MIPEDESVIEEEEDANLTDAEREAMNLDLDDEEEGDAPIPDEEVEEEEEAEPEAEEEEEAEPEAEPEAEEEEAAPEQIEARQEVSPEPETDKYQEAVSGIDEQIKALRTQYSDGEIDTDDYLEQRDVLKDQKQDVLWEQRSENLLYQAELQAAQKQDQTNLSQAIGDFYSANPEYGKSKGLQGALDAHWQDVYNEADWQNKSYLARMNEAKRRADEELGRVAAPKEELAKVDDKTAKRELVKGRGQQKAPQTLADAPTADESTNEGGKYADLEGLNGTELEAAIAQKAAQYGESFVDDWLASETMQ